MKTIGVLLDNTDVSQLNWRVLSTLNNLNNERQDLNCIAFYMNPSPLCVNNFCSIANIHEVHKVRSGVLIATNLVTAMILNKSQTLAKKIFYVWDLEFVHNKNMNYLNNYNILSSIDLFTRSESYKNAIKNYCGKNATVNSIEGLINAY